MNHDERDDDRLTRLLASVKADADPVLWTRVRARALARRPVPGLLAWAMRPVALASSFALLVGTAAIALTLTGSPTTAGEEYATLGEALLAEHVEDTAAPERSTAPVDSGAFE